MSFFEMEENEVNVQPDEEKINLAPIDNLGCESNFAVSDNRLKVSGGSTSVSTHSQKLVVSANNCLESAEFQELTEDEKRARWKWARTSEEVAKAKRMEKDFLILVIAGETLSLKKKQDIKRNKYSKMMKALGNCKRHGGPVSALTISLLKSLNEKQLLQEMAFLRHSVAPDIRQQRRVKTATGRFRVQKFSLKELRGSISDVMSPSNEVDQDIDKLLLNGMK